MKTIFGLALIIAVFLICSQWHKVLANCGFVAGVPNDEFVGPFASWKNVQTVYGATGNGTSDDTTAIQNALTANLTGGVVYFPAGTYLVSSTLTIPSGEAMRLVGADPSTTTIKWNGAAGGTMLSATGGNHQELSNRLTWDGAIGAGGNAHYLIQMNSSNSAWRLIMDSVFKNTDATGMGVIMAGTDDTDSLFIRDTFINDSVGIGFTSGNSSNNLQNRVLWCTFQNVGVGLQGGQGAGGNFQVYNSYFTASTIADIQVPGAMIYSARDNVSIGSHQFLVSTNSNPSPWVVENNRIVNTTANPAITFGAIGDVAIVDNQITNTSATGPYVSVNAGGTNTAFLSLGNQFNISPSSAISEGTGGTNNYLTIDDAQSMSINTAAPTMPPTPPNLHRTIIDVAAGTGTASTDTANVQNAINTACSAPDLGTRTVIHLPGSTYNINATLSIPASCDVQLLGDGICSPGGTGGVGHSALSWSGTAGNAIINIAAPGKAVISNFCMLGSTAFDGIHVHLADVVGSRVQMVEPGMYDLSGNSLSMSGLTNALVNLYHIEGLNTNQQTVASYDVSGNGLASAPSRLAIFGGGGGTPGGTCNSFTGTQFHVSNQGNIVEWDGWFENGPMFILNEASGETGTFVDSGTNWALSCNINGTTTWTCSTAPPTHNATFNVNGFVGTSLTGPGFTSCNGTNQWTQASNSSTTSQDMLWQIQSSFSSDWTAAPQTSTAGEWGALNRSLLTPKTNLGTTTAALVRSVWALERSTVPSVDTTLPVGVDDVQIFRVIMRSSPLVNGVVISH